MKISNFKFIKKKIICPACSEETEYAILDGTVLDVIACPECFTNLEINVERETVTATFDFDGATIQVAAKSEKHVDCDNMANMIGNMVAHGRIAAFHSLRYEMFRETRSLTELRKAISAMIDLGNKILKETS